MAATVREFLESAILTREIQENLKEKLEKLNKSLSN